MRLAAPGCADGRSRCSSLDLMLDTFWFTDIQSHNHRCMSSGSCWNSSNSHRSHSPTRDLSPSHGILLAGIRELCNNTLGSNMSGSTCRCKRVYNTNHSTWWDIRSSVTHPVRASRDHCDSSCGHCCDARKCFHKSIPVSLSCKRPLLSHWQPGTNQAPKWPSSI